MSWNSKVVWSEGMLLQPQHLQQHDRYLHSLLEGRAGGLRPYPWGWCELDIDEAQLALGKIVLRSCKGVLPDGTPLTLPAEDELPVPLDVPDDARNVQVVLALPLRRMGVPEVANQNSPDNFARHCSAEYEAWDSNGLDNSALMQVGRLRLRLALETDVANGYVSLGLARIIEKQPDNRVLLDPDYYPPALQVRAAGKLAGVIDELVGLLHQRGHMLAGRLGQADGRGAAEIADFLMLQLLNRAEPLLAHLATMSGLHPEQLYCHLIQLAGELATFSRADKRASSYPVYRHDQLRETFQPVLADLRVALSQVIDGHVVPLPLVERQFGVRVAVLQDHSLVLNAVFVLAVQAQIPAETIRQGFPGKVKMGSVEKIRDLVNLQLPGIGLRPLPVAPRQLPFHAGYTYFELDRNSDLLRQMVQSAGFAIHVPDEFPGLHMQFWAIRS